MFAVEEGVGVEAGGATGGWGGGGVVAGGVVAMGRGGGGGPVVDGGYLLVGWLGQRQRMKGGGKRVRVVNLLSFRQAL